MPERFDRVAKHFTVDESAKYFVTARTVFCFLQKREAHILQTLTHVLQPPVAHRQTDRHTPVHVVPHLCSAPFLFVCGEISGKTMKNVRCSE